MSLAVSEKVSVNSIKLTVSRGDVAGDAPQVREYIIEEPLVTIGSAPSCAIQLEAEAVAAEHCIIINEGGESLLVNQSEGTLLNGEELPLAARWPLAEGDQIQVGEFSVTFSYAAGAREAFAAEPAINEIGEAIPEPEAEDEAVSDEGGVGGQALAKTSNNSFAAILDSLRTDEDRYYFLLESGTQSGARLLVEDQELIVGWDQTGGNITADPWAVALPRLRVTKNWSGVFVAAPHPDEVEVNGEMLGEPRRLRHGDRVVIAPALSPSEDGVVLVFHEPTSLVVLDNLLPEYMPAPGPVGADNEAVAEQSKIAEAPAELAGEKQKHSRKKKKPPRALYFGAFTATDLLLMATGTLLGAVVVFLFWVYG
jgi:hypothetical protein